MSHEREGAPRSALEKQREGLPIAEFKQEIIDAVRAHKVCVVVGETGSGKTTQVPQYLYEAGFGKEGKIGVTQPRRVAAISVARRVAEEMGVDCGSEVGYTIRFDDHTSEKTAIKYMTDGVLLRECLASKDLQDYSVIILDEAHERSIYTDVLFGLLKNCARRRDDIRVVIMSATLDAEKFSRFFFDCPVLKVPGRVFDVAIFHTRTTEKPAILAQYSEVRPTGIHNLETAVKTVLRIHCTEPPGHILLFLTGQDDIEKAVRRLDDRVRKLEAERKYQDSKFYGDEEEGEGPEALPPPEMDLWILPVYGNMPSELQTRIFDEAPPHVRKCIIATNIAETSLTVDGVAYVVDPGYVKQKMYNPLSGMDSLEIVQISQVAASQRAGRAGRTREGKCYRLYSKYVHDTEMARESVPEIKRANLSNVVLTLKCLGVEDVLAFEFLDPPSQDSLVDALKRLYFLGALDEEGCVTEMGQQMASYPLDPSLARVLIASKNLKCLEEALTVVAMLSVENVFYRPSSGGGVGKAGRRDDPRLKEAAACHRSFAVEGSDHLTLKNVYDKWLANGRSDSWTRQNYLQTRAMRTAHSIRQQLSAMAANDTASKRNARRNPQQETEEWDKDKKSTDEETRDASERKRKRNDDKRDVSEEFGPVENRVLMALCEGFYPNAAAKAAYEGYIPVIKGPKGQTNVHIHPSSALAELYEETLWNGGNPEPDWVIFHEIMWTSKPFMRQVSAVKDQWLRKLLPKLMTADPKRLSRHTDLKLDAIRREEAETAEKARLSGQTGKIETAGVSDSKPSLSAPSREEIAKSARERYLQRKKGLA
eukprot:tig00000842_g4821.t2